MINEQKGYFIVLFGEKKEVLLPLIVSIFEKGYVYFFLVCCFVGFLFWFGFFSDC